MILRSRAASATFNFVPGGLLDDDEHDLTRKRWSIGDGKCICTTYTQENGDGERDMV